MTDVEKAMRIDAVDVIDLLLAQHARIEEQFRAVRTARGAARRNGFASLVHLLTVHETAEEELVHPLARASIDAGPEVTAARLDEEREANAMMLRLLAMGPDDPAFDAEFDRLRIAVLTHARREERYEFIQLRAARPPEELVALAEALRVAEATTEIWPTPGVAGPAEPRIPHTETVERIRAAIHAAMRADGRGDGHG